MENWVNRKNMKMNLLKVALTGFLFVAISLNIRGANIATINLTA